MSAPPVPADEPARLAALQGYALLDTPPDPFFDRIAGLAAALLRTPIALVTLVDESRQWFKATVGLNIRQTSREDAFCAHAISGCDTLVVPDATQDPRFVDNALVTGAPNIRFYAGAPLLTPDGLGLGTVCVIDVQPRAGLTAQEQDVLRELAGLVMAHLETRRALGRIDPVSGMGSRAPLLDDLERRLADTATRTGVVVMVVDVLDPVAYDELTRALGYDYADTFLVAAGETIRKALPAQAPLYHLRSVR
ncbi:MAG: GAF domain-containing protein, partial [Gammaproteobacteria bacterium]